MPMSTLHLFATLSITALLVSFTPPTAPSLATGAYGVCGCGTSTATGPNISLALNDDQSFHYVNGTDHARLVDVTGTWAMEKNKVVLRTAANEEFATWTVDKNSSCLRTRQGLLFTRLCQLEACD